LAFFLGIADDRVCNCSAKTVGDNRSGSVNLDIGGSSFSVEPDENIGIGHLSDNRADLGKLLFNRSVGHAYRELLFFFHSFYHTARYTGKANESIHRKGRA